MAKQSEGAKTTKPEMTATEAALILGISRERVIRLVQVGRLTGRRDPSGGWRVVRETVEQAQRLEAVAT